MKKATPGSGTTRTGMVALPPHAQADPLCSQVDPPQVQDLPLTQAQADPPQVQANPLAQAGHPRRSREDQAHRPRCAAQRAGSVSPTRSFPRQHHQVQDQHQHRRPRNVKVIIPKTILQFKKSYRMGFKRSF